MTHARTDIVKASAGQDPNLPKIFVGKTNDTLATVLGANYFDGSYDRFTVGDQVNMACDMDDTPDYADLRVTGISGTTVTVAVQSIIAKEFSGILEGTATWNPSSIADGDEEAKEVTVTGAALGDAVLVQAPVDVTDLTVSATVTAADTVTVILANNTGGAIDLAEATWKVQVLQAR